MYNLFMSRKAPKTTCSLEQKQKLEKIVHSHTAEIRQIKRAKIILACLEDKPINTIAADLETRPNTVIKWRSRFEAEGIDGLSDQLRSGKPPVYGVSLRNNLLTTLEKPTPPGLARWDAPALSDELGASKDAIWRILRKEGIHLNRQRSWCISHDPEFTPKAAAIVGLYLAPPENAFVISVDEKPGIQAIERETGYIETDNHKIVRGYKSTYKRHGTLNLFAALNVATGVIKTQTTKLKRRVEFLGFMDSIMADTPSDKEVHVILDNYSTHKKNQDWLEKHPNVFFHFTPTGASWLNQVEIWFSILSRKALRGASFKNTENLRTAIEEYIKVYSKTPKPFVWRKREVKGTQLRNNISNLRN